MAEPYEEEQPPTIPMRRKFTDNSDTHRIRGGSLREHSNTEALKDKSNIGQFHSVSNNKTSRTTGHRPIYLNPNRRHNSHSASSENSGSQGLESASYSTSTCNTNSNSNPSSSRFYSTTNGLPEVPKRSNSNQSTDQRTDSPDIPPQITPRVRKMPIVPTKNVVDLDHKQPPTHFNIAPKSRPPIYVHDPGNFKAKQVISENNQNLGGLTPEELRELQDEMATLNIVGSDTKIKKKSMLKNQSTAMTNCITNTNKSNNHNSSKSDRNIISAAKNNHFGSGFASSSLPKENKLASQHFKTNTSNSSNPVLRATFATEIESRHVYPSERQLLNEEAERIANKKREIEELIKICEEKLKATGS